MLGRIKASCDFLYGPPGAGVNLYRACTEIVRKSCNLSAVAVQFLRPPHGNRMEPVRVPCGGCLENGAVIVQLPYHIWACGLRAVPMRGLCNATYDMSTGYGLMIFSNLYNFTLKKIIEAAEPVNPYENLTAASCLRRGHKERGIWAGYRLHKPIAGQMWIGH